MTAAEDTIRTARDRLRIVNGTEPADSADDSKDRKPSHGALMRQLLDDHYTLVRSTDGRTYGIANTDPGRAIAHAPQSSPLIRGVSRMFLDTTGQWPSSTGVAEASAYTLAMFDEAPVRPVPLRSHWDRSRRVLHLDTCDQAGTVLRIDADGVRPAVAPVAFRQPAVPCPIPWDSTEGTPADIARLWGIVPVAKQDRPIVLAAMITAWLTETPQPIVFLTGTQDAGKTSTARYLLSFVDPVGVPRGKALPVDEREWKSAVAYSRAVLVDNLSGLNAAASDLLCRVSTGGEASSRALYTDDGTHVTALHVPVWLTAIDAGALRGDLASRMVKVELLPLDETSRLAESDLADKQEEIRQEVTRGLLWLASAVFDDWASVNTSRLPHRMGDFAIILRCIDQIMGTNGEARLVEDAQDLAADVVDASPIALAVVKLAEAGGTDWATSTALLERLNEAEKAADQWWRPDKGWPRTPKVLSAQLTRVAPALRKARGIDVEHRKSNGTRLIRIVKAA